MGSRDVLYLISYSVLVYFLMTTVFHPILTAVIFFPPLAILVFSILYSPFIWAYLGDDNTLRFFMLVFLIAIFLFPPIYYSAVSSISSELKRGPMPESIVTRNLPYDVARHYMEGAISGAWSLGDIDPLLIDGKMMWVGPLHPPGFSSLSGPVGGIVLQDAMSIDARATVEETHFSFTEVGLTNNVYWHITMSNPGLHPTQVIYVKHDGRWWQVVSVEGYEFRGWYSKPVWAGVFIFDENGVMEYLDPEEAVEDPRLEGVPIYPESLARFYLDSYFWKTGVINSLFYHVGQEVVDDYQSEAEVEENSQPYLAQIGGRLFWLGFLKPYGTGKTLSKIVLVDAHNGTAWIVDVSDKGWAGPTWSAQQVKRHRPNYVFVQKAEEGKSEIKGFVVREPMPVLEGDRLIWKIAITPSDATGVAEIIHIDARTGDEVPVAGEDEVQKEEVKTNVTSLIAVPEIITTFVRNGNTRYIVKIGNLTALARAEDLNWKEIALLTSGEEVLIHVDEKGIIVRVEHPPS